MPKQTNRARSSRIAALLWDVRETTDSPSEAVTGLLADLRHYCDAHALDFAQLDRVAYRHYTAEKGEQRQATLGARLCEPQRNAPARNQRDVEDRS